MAIRTEYFFFSSRVLLNLLHIVAKALFCQWLHYPTPNLLATRFKNASEIWSLDLERDRHIFRPCGCNLVIRNEINTAQRNKKIPPTIYKCLTFGCFCLQEFFILGLYFAFPTLLLRLLNCWCNLFLSQTFTAYFSFLHTFSLPVSFSLLKYNFSLLTFLSQWNSHLGDSKQNSHNTHS